MDDDLDINEELQKRLETTTPRCLNLVAAERIDLIERREENASSFRLSDRLSGEQSATLLGFPLRELDPSFDGTEFVSPISIRWADGASVEIFDSKHHGYHGELDAAANLRGKGTPHEFHCPKCGSTTVEVAVQFDYSGGCCDLFEDEPEELVENYFTNILIQATCRQCGEASNAVDMNL